MARIILNLAKHTVIWLLRQRWFLWLLDQRWFVRLWSGCFGVKILCLPAYRLSDIAPAQMIDIPDIQVEKKYPNHLFDSFKQDEPMRDDKNPIAIRIINDAVTIAAHAILYQ